MSSIETENQLSCCGSTINSDNTSLGWSQLKLCMATVNVRVITKLYIYIDESERQRPAFNYFELNQINYLDMVMSI